MLCFFHNPKSIPLRTKIHNVSHLLSFCYPKKKRIFFTNPLCRTSSVLGLPTQHPNSPTRFSCYYAPIKILHRPPKLITKWTKHRQLRWYHQVLVNHQILTYLYFTLYSLLFTFLLTPFPSLTLVSYYTIECFNIIYFTNNQITLIIPTLLILPQKLFPPYWLCCALQYNW